MPHNRQQNTKLQNTLIRLTNISRGVLVLNLPVVGEDLQGHRGQYFQRLPSKVFMDQLLGSFGQRAQGLLQTHKLLVTAQIP